MTPISPHQNDLSSTERRRQLEESTARAMDRYKTELEAVRAKTSRLRAAREALPQEPQLKAARPRRAKKPA